MDLLVVAINAVVIAAVGGIVAWLGRGRFEAIDRRFDSLETRLDDRFDSLETRLDGRIDGLETRLDGRTDELGTRVDRRVDSLERRMDAFQTSMDAMRSDITQVALAVGVRRGPLG